MKLVLGAGVVVVAALATLWAAYYFGWWEYTNCYAAFDSHESAERAASAARAAGFDADLEAPGPDARRPTSRGARGISVVFSDGETGEDGAAFRAAVNRLIVAEDGTPARLDAGCDERPLLDGG